MVVLSESRSSNNNSLRTLHSESGTLSHDKLGAGIRGAYARVQF